MLAAQHQCTVVSLLLPPISGIWRRTQLEIVAKIKFPIRIFLRLQLNDNNVIVGSDYTLLQSRTSCYVKLTSPLNPQPEYAKVRHFVCVTVSGRELAFACANVFKTAPKEYCHYPMILPQSSSPLVFVPVQYIEDKVNLFPILGDSDDEVGGYFVSPSCKLGRWWNK